MKSFLFLLTLVLSYSASAQFYIGLTEKEARQQIYSKQEIPSSAIQKVYNKDATWYLTFHDLKQKSTSVIVFDSSSLSNGLAMIPDDVQTFNRWVESFNKSFVTISDMKWKSYTGGKIYEIEAVFSNDTDTYTVVITIAK